MDYVSFKAKARTIDHLGRGQIADCPTAISELWKNSYDAYARNVGLHLFDTPTKCAAILDNGCGMTYEQVLENWLVIGTEAKSTKSLVPEKDRFGLSERRTQGEKGIGRLSAAFLAPVLLLITKKVCTTFTAALIDWRLFENPYLTLSDIKVPVQTFSSLDQLPALFPEMLKGIKENLADEGAGSYDNASIAKRVAWQSFTADERNNFVITGRQDRTTEQKIRHFCDTYKWQSEVTDSWSSFLDVAKDLDGEDHGTVLVMMDVHRELSLLADPGAYAADNHELLTVNKELTETLKSFVDPFFEPSERFEYEVARFARSGQRHAILSHNEVISLEHFNALEHTLNGSFDDRGWFRGELKCYGDYKVDLTIPPKIELADGKSKVGPFEFNLGTFEQELKDSSLPETEHAFFKGLAENHSGLMIFRDHLRVLPYGRPDNDFFEIEERRSRHAGRYYWGARRLFGRISITHNENNLLKDKAGREGFIINQAARELKQLVVNVLVFTAYNYLGTGADKRKEMKPFFNAEYARKKREQEKARKTTQRTFNQFLRLKSQAMEEGVVSIARFRQSLANYNNLDPEDIIEASEKLDEFERIGEHLRLPTKPAKLSDKEEAYRKYRDLYNEFQAYFVTSQRDLAALRSRLNDVQPDRIAKRQLESNQGKLNAAINGYVKTITSKLDNLKELWTGRASNDRCLYYSCAISTVESVINGGDLVSALNEVDSIYIQHKNELQIKYEPFINALNQLDNDVDLDSAFHVTEEERVKLEERVRNLHALAQLGISVEIIGHELDDLDAQASRGFNMMPSAVKAGPAYKMAYNAHNALTRQLRFLSPLKLSGYQSRTNISGEDIANHIFKFFGERFQRQRTKIDFTADFLAIEFSDLVSRIYPVFLNLINNALYWVTLSNERHIIIDFIDGKVVISNSGPPVDTEDIPRLFEIFYSRRVNGRGVGLYLCRENLAASHHTIRYAEGGDPKPYPNGANFIIEFMGVKSND